MTPLPVDCIRTDSVADGAYSGDDAMQQVAAQRNELFAVTATGTPMSPAAGSFDARRRTGATGPSTDTGASPFRAPTALREEHALREHSFIQHTDTRLDDFIAQGREVLDNLVDKRNVLKGTQRRLLDAANTIGLSRNVINWIERRR